MFLDEPMWRESTTMTTFLESGNRNQESFEGLRDRRESIGLTLPTIPRFPSGSFVLTAAFTAGAFGVSSRCNLKATSDRPPWTSATVPSSFCRSSSVM